MQIAIESIAPYVTFSAKEAADIPLYNTQAELQLLSKLKSQSYKKYIGDLAALPEMDISTDLDSADIDIDRQEVALTAASLLPTQREIYLDATLPKLHDDDVPLYFEDIVEIKHPIITFNGQFVIDGHHRWLSVMAINPRAKISAIDFTSEYLTPVQFLKLLQGAIVMEKGELPKVEKSDDSVDIFHRSNKVIREYIEKTISPKILFDLRSQLSLDTNEKALDYIVQNVLSVKYNNLPAIGSPSRELMPQTDNKSDILQAVQESPVLAKDEE